jgi:RimJ/RimL family protein N-acetyltransferase
MTLETHRHPDVVREFADHVPDLAPFVDVRGALLCGRSFVVSGNRPESFAVIAPHVPLVCVVGHPAADVIVRAVELVEREASESPVLAVAPESVKAASAALPDWRRETAILHVRPAQARWPPTDSAPLRWLERTTRVERLLDHVPESLRAEMLDAVQHQAVVCAWVDDRPVAFAYAPWCTERWFDISIDTLESYRHRGFATACARALIERHSQAGRQPVWGAVESNVASRTLAARLGFQPAGTATVFEGSLGLDGDDDLVFEGI